MIEFNKMTENDESHKQTKPVIEKTSNEERLEHLILKYLESKISAGKQTAEPVNPSQHGFQTKDVQEKNVYKLDQSELEKIESIILQSAGRYDDKDAFIREAIELMYLFWTSPGEKLNQKMQNMWKNLPEKTKEYVRKNSYEYSRMMDYVDTRLKHTTELDKTFDEFKSILKNIREKLNQKNCTVLYRPGRNSPNSRNSIVIHNKYDRIFPSKLVLMLLADEVLKQSNHSDSSVWIDYEQFRESIFDKIQKISLYLKQKEQSQIKKLSLDGNPREIKVKTKRLTVGLPFVSLTIANYAQQQKEKSSKNKFLETYVGSTTRAWLKTSESVLDGIMTGILYDFGLVGFIFDGHLSPPPANFSGDRPTSEELVRRMEEVTKFKKTASLKIGLTSQGLEFLKLENPIFDVDSYERTLGVQEGYFYQNTILPRFKLEQKIVNMILSGKTWDIYEIMRQHSSWSLGKKDLNYDSLGTKTFSVLDAELIENIIKTCIIQTMYEPEGILTQEIDSHVITLDDFYWRYIERGGWIFGEDDYDEEKAGRTGEKNFQRWLTNYRISLMGRMSEASLIRWEIENNKSKYYLLDK